jgi:hypothetical protein
VQHFIYQGGFAVVNVGNNRNVANVLTVAHSKRLEKIGWLVPGKYLKNPI